MSSVVLTTQNYISNLSSPLSVQIFDSADPDSARVIAALLDGDECEVTGAPVMVRVDDMEFTMLPIRCGEVEGYVNVRHTIDWR